MLTYSPALRDTHETSREWAVKAKRRLEPACCSLPYSNLDRHVASRLAGHYPCTNNSLPPMPLKLQAFLVGHRRALWFPNDAPNCPEEFAVPAARNAGPAGSLRT